MGGYGCESYSYSDGWYRFEGDYQPAMTPVGNGQCGTSEPIWMKGLFKPLWCTFIIIPSGIKIFGFCGYCETMKLRIQ